MIIEAGDAFIGVHIHSWGGFEIDPVGIEEGQSGGLFGVLTSKPEKAFEEILILLLCIG